MSHLQRCTFFTLALLLFFLSITPKSFAAFSASSYADTTVSLSSPSVNWGDAITVTVSNIPDINANLHLKVFNTAGNELGHVQIKKNRDNDTCSISDENENNDTGTEMLDGDNNSIAGSNLSCSFSNGKFQVTGTIQTLSLPPSTSAQNYTVTINEDGVSTGTLSDKNKVFNVAASNANLLPSIKLEPKEVPYTEGQTPTSTLTITGIDLRRPEYPSSLDVTKGQLLADFSMERSGDTCKVSTNNNGSVFSGITCTEVKNKIFSLTATVTIQNLSTFAGDIEQANEAQENLSYPFHFTPSFFIGSTLTETFTILRNAEPVDFDFTMESADPKPGGIVKVAVTEKEKVNNEYSYQFVAIDGGMADFDPTFAECGDTVPCVAQDLTIPEDAADVISIKVCETKSGKCLTKELSVTGGAASAPVTSPPPPPPCADGTIEVTGCSKINSAFGEIGTTPEEFVRRLFGILLGISGGIALFIIILSGYRFITSQGNPEKVKEAQERITSAIVGLIFLIFSIVILEVIGVDVLQLPGLGK